jgi:hypothetical protein
MSNQKFKFATAVFITLLVIAFNAAADNCGSEPSVSGASSFQSWRQWCTCKGGTSASNLIDAQRQGGCHLSSGSSSGTSGESVGTVIGNLLGDAINKQLFGDPEADAKRRMQENLRAEQERRAAEESDRRAEESKNRLLGGMKGAEGSPSLSLKGFESAPELSLKTDTRPSTTKRSDIYTKGFEHASQCISQNAGTACVGVSAEQQQSCVADYRAGYDSGSIQKNLVMEEASQAGQAAKQRGELANGASDQRAQGKCRFEWIYSYNRGYGQ